MSHLKSYPVSLPQKVCSFAFKTTPQNTATILVSMCNRAFTFFSQVLLSLNCSVNLRDKNGVC